MIRHGFHRPRSFGTPPSAGRSERFPSLEKSTVAGAFAGWLSVWQDGTPKYTVALEQVDASPVQLVCFLTSNLVNRFVQLQDDMKPVKNHGSLRGILNDDHQVKVPHVAADALETGATFSFPVIERVLQSPLGTPHAITQQTVTTFGYLAELVRVTLPFTAAYIVDPNQDHFYRKYLAC